jgi:hypothetical protein
LRGREFDAVAARCDGEIGKAGIAERAPSGIGGVGTVGSLDLQPVIGGKEFIFQLRRDRDADTWNYVFGQASLEKRVGVWSLWRLGRDNGKPASADLLLARTLKIAMHETGHMFSMRHCIKYECLMSGTNHLDETDRRPLDACPECAAKISWAMRYPLADRYKNLAAFWKRFGRVTEEREMLDKAGALCGCKVEVP